MHAQGKLCTGNMVGSPHVQTIYGHLLDKHGGEILFHEPTRNLRAFRTLAYQNRYRISSCRAASPPVRRRR